MPPRQADIGDQQVDTDIRLQQLQPGEAVSRLDQGVAQITQHVGQQQAYRRLIIDDEDRPAGAGERCGRLRRGRSAGTRLAVIAR